MRAQKRSAARSVLVEMGPDAPELMARCTDLRALPFWHIQLQTIIDFEACALELQTQ